MMKKRYIPTFAPHLPRKVIKAVNNTLKGGWINIGKKTEEFERRFHDTKDN